MKQNSDYMQRQANAAFKKEERAREGLQARQEYESAGDAVREKTARLRSLRMAKEATAAAKK
jgi:hypothetical protein